MLLLPPRYLQWDLSAASGSDADDDDGNSTTKSLPLVGAVRVTVYEHAAAFDYAGTVAASVLLGRSNATAASPSEEADAWKLLLVAEGGLLGTVDVDLEPPVALQALRLVHVMLERYGPNADTLVPVYEVQAWGADGP
jgi:hypothetical protein